MWQPTNSLYFGSTVRYRRDSATRVPRSSPDTVFTTKAGTRCYQLSSVSCGLRFCYRWQDSLYFKHKGQSTSAREMRRLKWTEAALPEEQGTSQGSSEPCLPSGWWEIRKTSTQGSSEGTGRIGKRCCRLCWPPELLPASHAHNSDRHNS